jgi:hypothetical protein
MHFSLTHPTIVTSFNSSDDINIQFPYVKLQFDDETYTIPKWMLEIFLLIYA